MSDRVYVIPGDNDVLCGRGRVYFEHTGNIRFRDIIERALPGYAKAATKGEKTCFVRSVVNEIFDEGGRFLKLDRSADRWYEGDIVCAKSKVGHAFRDAISEQQGHTPSSSSDSDDGSAFEEFGSDSQDSEVSFGASSLLLLGKVAGAKIDETKPILPDRTRGAKQASFKPPEIKRPLHPAASATVSAIIPSTGECRKETSRVSPAASPRKGEKSFLETSHAHSQNGQQRVSSLAVVKQAMLKTLVLRQQALSKTFRRPPEADFLPSMDNIDTSSSQSSNSSRASEMLEATDQSSLNANGITKRKAPESKAYSPRACQLSLPTCSTSEVKSPNQITLTRQGLLIGTTQKLIPGMLNSAELKEAMLGTLAARQEALGKYGNLQMFSMRDGRLQVNDLIQKAKSTRPLSAREILQQAIEAQNNSIPRPAVKTQTNHVPNPERRQAHRLKKHPLKQADTNPPTQRSIKKLVNVPTENESEDEDHFGVKRRRSQPKSSPSNMFKKLKPLAELAEENSLQLQARFGPCYPCGSDANVHQRYYFL